MQRRSAQLDSDQDSNFLPLSSTHSFELRDNASYPYPPRLKSPYNGNATTSHVSNQVGSKQSRSTHRRQRHCAHPDCPIEIGKPVSHHFDQLPWISIMDIPPSEFPSYDIADLSQLPVPGPYTSNDPGSGPAFGAVRRRKRSFRTDPLCFSLEHSSSPITSLGNCTSQTISSTPPPKARRPRTFHRLMPVFSCDTHSLHDAKLSIPSHFLP
ncbi:hypothetical protein E1B28_008735 [Marasmius oreades]|uniref:Uncharacterized protein n=1 Tax=Marasmius oreades TaxID=181124 RepID=A0A9P7RZJ1_9AGAR|nr:uncharacterized protein E1B28_008735 [Marasmius oreades]KAG7092378.1 hypothetical protein E1B28_008735 [Marasmius oreades]